MPTDIKTTLLPDEVRELAECEGVIRRGLNSFYEVGAALTAIKQGRLYRAEFPNFAEYCAVRWGIGESQANRSVQAAKTVDILTEAQSGLTAPVGARPAPIGAGSLSLVPRAESQLRPLTALSPGEKIIAWESAVKGAGGKQPTAKQVCQAVKDVQGGAGAVESRVRQEADGTDSPASIRQEQAVQPVAENDGFQPGAEGWANILEWSCVAGCEIEWNPLQRRYIHHRSCILHRSVKAANAAALTPEGPGRQ